MDNDKPQPVYPSVFREKVKTFFYPSIDEGRVSVKISCPFTLTERLNLKYSYPFFGLPIYLKWIG